MDSVICVHERFERIWPFAADYWHACWGGESACALYRTDDAEVRAPQLVASADKVRRLALLGFPAEESDLEPFTSLQECFHDPRRDLSTSGIEAAEQRGVRFVPLRSDLYWGQSVAEFALGLTICALRQIPQRSAAMSHDPSVWDFMPAVGRPGRPGAQMADDTRFSSGTIDGKRVRVAGVGNIGGRYATWCQAMGADVAGWDPFATQATFTLARTSRRFSLMDLVEDAQIFAPMLPPRDETLHIVSADVINALPKGCLVVQVTRAFVCDLRALYRRVLADELALASDVFADRPGPGSAGEPVPLDSPLLGRANVVHTPHIAGRTIDANHAWVDDIVSRFVTR